MAKQLQGRYPDGSYYKIMMGQGQPTTPTPGQVAATSPNTRGTATGNGYSFQGTAADAAKFMAPVTRTAGSMTGPRGYGPTPSSQMQPQPQEQSQPGNWQAALQAILTKGPEQVSGKGWTAAERSQRQASRNIQLAREQMKTIQAMAQMEGQESGATARTGMTTAGNLAVQNLQNQGTLATTGLKEQGDTFRDSMKEQGAMARTQAMVGSQERTAAGELSYNYDSLARNILSDKQKSMDERVKLLMNPTTMGTAPMSYAKADALARGYDTLSSMNSDQRAQAQAQMQKLLYGNGKSGGLASITDPEQRRKLVEQADPVTQAMIYDQFGDDLSQLTVPGTPDQNKNGGGW